MRKQLIGEKREIPPTKYTVLMSVYFKENSKYFDLALESNLCKQTLTPSEFVLICDGPLTSELDAVIDKYSLKYENIFKVYRLEKNLGLGKALNFGLAKCTNDYVARSDSDDICIETRFEKQVNFLDNNPDISIVGSDIDEFDNEWDKPRSIKVMPRTHKEIENWAKLRNPMNHMTVMFKKNDIEKVGSYRHIPYVEDYDLWVRCIANGLKLSNIHECLVHARVGNGMVNRRGNKKSIKSWEIVNKYMLKNKMITHIRYFSNMVAIIAFTFIPSSVRAFCYNKFLRK